MTKPVLPDFSTSLKTKLDNDLARIDISYSSEHGRNQFKDKYYRSLNEMLHSIPSHLDDGFTINPKHSHSHIGAGYTISYLKPKKLITKEIKESKNAVLVQHQEEIKRLEEEWLDNQLQEALEAEQRALVEEHEREVKESKAALLKALRG